MTSLKRILLVEDSPRDAELILDALGGHQLANEVVHVRDGADALDYLYRRGVFADRSDGQPAMISRSVGKGRISYLGTVLDLDLMKRVIDRAVDGAQLKPEFGALPAGVEVCRRIDGKRTVFVVINHNLAEQDPSPLPIALSAPMQDVLHDDQTITSVDLAPQGVAVLESDEP